MTASFMKKSNHQTLHVIEFDPGMLEKGVLVTFHRDIIVHMIYHSSIHLKS